MGKSSSSVVGAFGPYDGDVLRVGSTRRGFLQTGLSGLAGMSMPMLLSERARAVEMGEVRGRSNVILFWLSGGPSHIDMWDPKPEAPREVRGPYGHIQTKVAGVHVCEHLPLTARIMDKLTLIRSVDCTASNHTPITMQACNPMAKRTNDGRDGGGWPSMGSIAAKFRGANAPGIPGYVALADSMVSDIWGAGQMGGEFDPVNGKELAGRLALADGLTIERLGDRKSLLSQLDAWRRAVDTSERVASTDRYTQQAFEVLMHGSAQRAFDLSQETEAMRDRYGRDSLGEKALLARRLVEAGSTFVTVSGAWGYFDHHGDEVRWGGIEKGLTPLLPSVDRTLHAMVTDLEDRGLLDSTLVLMMGEFGRAPFINKNAGRDHWPRVMSMVVAGGKMRHGQVIGSTDRYGGEIATRRVMPGDLAATVFHHLGIRSDYHWIDPQGRPRPIVTDGGQPISELVG